MAAFTSSTRIHHAVDLFQHRQHLSLDSYFYAINATRYDQPPQSFIPIIHLAGASPWIS